MLSQHPGGRRRHRSAFWRSRTSNTPGGCAQQPHIRQRPAELRPRPSGVRRLVLCRASPRVQSERRASVPDSRNPHQDCRRGDGLLSFSSVSRSSSTGGETTPEDPGWRDSDHPAKRAREVGSIQKPAARWCGRGWRVIARRRRTGRTTLADYSLLIRRHAGPNSGLVCAAQAQGFTLPRRPRTQRTEVAATVPL